MSGKVTRKYIGELTRFNKKINRPLKKVKEILPIEYTSEIIINEFQKYYPLVWKEMEEQYTLYSNKDKFLIEQGKKIRYKPLKPKEYILSLHQVKLWLNERGLNEHKRNFNSKIRDEAIILLDKKAKNTLSKFESKILKNTKNIQEIEPLHIEFFITAYHQKGIKIEEKIEIFNELKKYNSEKTIEFFYKLNDAERNDQIRKMAFEHLQSIGKYVKLRSNFKGKKKDYTIETSEFDMTPKDLVRRIKEDSIQNKKEFHFFISHSSTNSNEVLKAIYNINKQGYNAYCDWTSDNDFLKRTLISDFTKIVLKKRLDQSENILFIKSKRALESEWVSLELEYFEKLNKPIYFIELDDSNDSRLKKFIKLEYDFEKDYLNIPNELKKDNNSR